MSPRSLRAPSAALAIALAVVSADPAAAGMRLEEFRGHLAVGYGALFVKDSPPGSLSVSGGVDYPLAQNLRLGISFASTLLGSRTVERGSLIASVDYSQFESLLLFHWQPGWPGPVARISAGGGLASARATLSTAGGGAAFSDLAREEVRPEAELAATLMSRRPSPVRVGLELAAGVAFLREETWTLATARVAFHY